MSTRRLSTRILASQVLVLAIALASGVYLFTRELRTVIDRGYETRALSIAEAAADDGQIRSAMASGDHNHDVQEFAVAMRRGTGVSFIVVHYYIRVSMDNPVDSHAA